MHKLYYRKCMADICMYLLCLLKCVIFKVGPVLPHEDSKKMLEHRPSHSPTDSTLSPLGLTTTCLGFPILTYSEKWGKNVLDFWLVQTVCFNTNCSCTYCVVHFLLWDLSIGPYRHGGHHIEINFLFVKHAFYGCWGPIYGSGCLSQTEPRFADLTDTQYYW